MTTHDYFSSLPTDELTAQQAYDCYWGVATSEYRGLANGTGPVYRFARDLMLHAIARDYDLTVSQVAWLYDELLPEGPGWGSLDRMVEYGRKYRFGEEAKMQRRLNCLTCREAFAALANDDDDAAIDLIHDSNAHAIDCPERN